MLGRADYRKRWKKAWYEKNGYAPDQDLFIADEEERGGLNSNTVRETAEDISRALGSKFNGHKIE
jgi:hypothetical protein